MFPAHRCSQGQSLTACLNPLSTVIAGDYRPQTVFSSVGFPELTVWASHSPHLCYATLQFTPQLAASSSLEVQLNATLRQQIFTLDMKEKADTALAVFIQVPYAHM